MKHSLTTLIGLILLVSCHDKTANTAEGTFEATEITVSAETAGRIVSFAFDEGDSIAQGSIIAVIDTTQLVLQRRDIAATREATLASRPDAAAQEASLAQQIANLNREKQRTERLLADGAATQKQLDDINYQIATLQKQLKGLSSSLSIQTDAINKQAASAAVKIEQIDEQIRKSSVAAPIGGTMLVKYKEQGEVVAAGTPLCKMADMQKVYLRAYLTSSQLSLIRIGQKLKVVADYGGGTEQEYEGVVTNIAQESEFTPKTIQTSDSRANLVYAVKVSVKNDGRLKLGLSGRVILE